MHWLVGSSHELVHLLNGHHYLALFVMILIEEAGCPLPLPGESLILYAGSRIMRGEMSVARVYAVVMPASAIGCTVLYLLARFGGRALLRKHFESGNLERLQAKAARLGPVGVLIGRLIPGIRVPTGIAAGVFKVPFGWYLAFALTATCLRLAFFLYLGATVQRVGAAMLLTREAKIAIGLVVVAIAAAGWLGWRRFRLNPKLQQSPG